MSDPPRRDHLPGQFGKHGSVECRGCGASLGTLSRNHTVFTPSANSAAFLPIGTARIDLVCLSCGAARYLRGDRLRGVTVRSAA